ncbi:MAG: L-ectoine synthase [Candidatus Yanofskybacteria bacterium CG10_big_fil_rev_8_21_14_0_10_36_16]|uniref:L-ectoine synthase n=1 Tax=Candidatus Yanofskybacteria bacterium CG10_big_fil_rev_8_21_14_0_10_36_16 TaxID=1975096 RepID=A0A2J0Q7V7_9BACT|nr:MAG: L-ectoine synthase [Candidatus Yanofskybacteria bacterium CG10_big_fil_rev_8_21_14_0_10_36_16]
MKIIKLNNIIGTSQEAKVPGDQGSSRRLLLAKDGLGYSFHDTIITAGAEMRLHYTNHIETVYCVSGNGEVEDLTTKKRHKIEEGVMYVLDKHDDHILHGGTEDMRLICIFTPALVGNERQDESGSFPIMNEVLQEIKQIKEKVEKIEEQL